ncbi:efflux RND transporter periplasmic adaptor subunit [Paraburkholderia sp. BL17N1]|uniref:efflux RND transporter periplasmic adaptor subunit n=1 Tax=Paraburkholderia sp. BL17N1 TaxID=1938798 RepID=UPI000EB29EF3|nr:efflux RND transporter periplasmic adaptor subunit [Paraburkholderia sp. BL17N1]RKR37644.1 RND family efflux transporter MFP subunit [Paraburkholderia sp. BL17N1]
MRQPYTRRRLKFAIALTAIALSSAHAAKPAGSGEGFDDPNAIRVLLVPNLETTLSSEMNGTITDLRASLGKQVAKSTVIAQMNCAEVQARANVAKAELNMANQNLVAKRSLRELKAAGDIEVSMASTDVEKAKGALSLAKAQLGYCQVVAPFSGRIAKVYVKPYQTVSAGTPIVDLVGDGALKVRLNVPSSMLVRLRPGTRLDVAIHETGKTYAAHVSAVNARVDAVAQTVELEAQLDGAPQDLVAGMSGIARIPANP